MLILIEIVNFATQTIFNALVDAKNVGLQMNIHFQKLVDIMEGRIIE